MSEDNKWSVVKFVQEMIVDEQGKLAITPAGLAPTKPDTNSLLN